MAPGQINLTLNVLMKMALSHAAAEGLLEPRAAQFYEALPLEYPANPGLQDRLATLAHQLGQSRRPIIVCGTDIVRDTTPALAADHALLLRAAGKRAGLFYLLPGPNAFGAALLSPGESPEGFLKALESGAVKALLLVENDPFWHYPDRERLLQALARLELLIVLDYVPAPAVKQAHIVLPTITLFERMGSSFVNQEGRLQWVPPVHAGGAPISQVGAGGHPPRTFLDHIPGGEPRSPGEIFKELARALIGKEMPPEDFEEFSWGRGLRATGPYPLPQGPLPQTLKGTLGPETSGPKAPPSPAPLNGWERGRAGSPYEKLPGPPPKQPYELRLLPDQAPEADFSLERIKPESEEASPDVLELLLVDQTFGTEELSSYSSHVHQAEKPPQLLLNAGDISRLGLGEGLGGKMVLHLPGGPVTVECQAAANMAPGVMILPRHRLLLWQKLKDWPARVPVQALERV